MWDAGIGTTGDNRRKARAVGVLDQVKLDHACDVSLRQARLKLTQDVGQTVVKHVDGLLQLRELFVVLDHPQVVERGGVWDHLDARGQSRADPVVNKVRQVE